MSAGEKKMNPVWGRAGERASFGACPWRLLGFWKVTKCGTGSSSKNEGSVLGTEHVFSVEGACFGCEECWRPLAYPWRGQCLNFSNYLFQLCYSVLLNFNISPSCFFSTSYFLWKQLLVTETTSYGNQKNFHEQPSCVRSESENKASNSGEMKGRLPR